MSLYHYTDVNSVKSILENKNIWLTDIRFLNDSSEFHDGMEYFRSALLNPQKGLFSCEKYADSAIEYLRSCLNGDAGLNDQPLFTCSFSKSNDLLSQWRAYGTYAIEFDEQALRTELLQLNECRYENLDKKNIAMHEITTAISKISRNFEDNSGCLSPQGIESINHILNVAASFKNYGFHEERESRVIRSAAPGDESIKFRTKGTRLIPYIEVAISLDCINSICLGPMQDQSLAHASMSMFVKNIESKWKSDSGDSSYALKVIASPTPYRGT